MTALLSVGWPIVIMLTRSVTILLLWRWFVVPYGVPEVGLPTVLGALLIFIAASGYLVFDIVYFHPEKRPLTTEFRDEQGKIASDAHADLLYEKYRKKEHAEIFIQMKVSLISPILALALGALVHLLAGGSL